MACVFFNIMPDLQTVIGSVLVDVVVVVTSEIGLVVVISGQVVVSTLVVVDALVDVVVSVFGKCCGPDSEI